MDDDAALPPARRRPQFDEQVAFVGAAEQAGPSGAYACLGSALRGGTVRRVRCADAVVWLQQHGPLPSRYHVITSLPDIGEIKPRVSPEEYEEWFTEVVRSLLAALDPHAVAIFYQTDGRQSGPEDTYLDKSYLCHRGARAANAACLFHRIVCAGPLGQPRGGGTRPSFAHLLCFSVGLRLPRNGSLQWGDVVPGRGHMAYAGAMGEHACAEAVAFVVRAHELRRPGQPTTETAEAAEALPEPLRDAPALVFDPFCGHGSVLAMANAWGLDAFGIDINVSRCEVSLRHRLKGDGAEAKPEARGTAPHQTGGLGLGTQCRNCDGDHPHCRQS